MINSCRIHGLYLTAGISQPCPRCIPESDPEQIVTIAGCDPGKSNDYFAYVDIRVENGIATLLSVKQWLHKNYPELANVISKRFFSAEIKLLAVDSTGVGQVVVDELIARGVSVHDLNYGKKVKPIWVNEVSDEAKLSPIKHEMIQWFRWLALEKRVKMLDSQKYPLSGELMKQLKEQELLEGADPTHHENVAIKYGHPSGTHDDLCWAYLMALYVARPWIEHGGVRTSFMRPPDYNPNRYVR